MRASSTLVSSRTAVASSLVGLGLGGSDLLPGSCEIPLRAVLVPARLSYDPVRNWMVNWIAPLGERIIIE